MAAEPNDNNFFDAYSPAEIARRVETVGVSKARMDFPSQFVLSLLAGAFIAMGAMAFTVVMSGSPATGLLRLVGGLIFSAGLIMIVVGGAELFTGNTLLVMAFVSRKISWVDVARNWAIVWVGNLLGALGAAVLVYYSNHASLLGGQVGQNMVAIANVKCHFTWLSAFFLGVICNALVCMAVWMSQGAKSVTGKVLAIPLPIAIFVACGTEHVVANMYFIPVGLMVDQGATPGLTWSAFFLNNMVPVTLGNIVGGGVLVGALYWFIYLRPAKRV